MIEIIKEVAKLQKSIKDNGYDMTVRIENIDDPSILIFSYEDFKKIAGDNPKVVEFNNKNKCRISSKLEGVEICTWVDEREYFEQEKAVAATTTKEKID